MSKLSEYLKVAKAAETLGGLQKPGPKAPSHLTWIQAPPPQH